MTSVLEPPDQIQTHGSDAAGSLTSVGKALTLLDAFNSPVTVLGVTELSTRAGLPKSTTHRLLAVLVDGGYVRRVGNQYCLTERMFELGNQVPMCSPSGLREQAAPVMTELFAETGETINLAIRVDNEVLYLEKVSGRRVVPWSTRVGSRGPLHCTGLGKTLLAFGASTDSPDAQPLRLRRYTPYTLSQPGRLRQSLERVREEGVAVDQEEFRLGLTCVAAPIIDHRSGRAIAAISITSATGSTDIRRFAPQLRRAADRISNLRRSATGQSAPPGVSLRLARVAN